jgi:dihydrofolate reductase
MNRLTAIVAVNEEGVIGAANRLPWRVKSDLRFFRQQTINNVVIMGRLTHDSLGGCLKQRLNIVVTRSFGLFVESDECLSAHGIVEALARAEGKRKRSQEVFVVGGASMYEQFSPYVDRYLITEVSKRVDDGDTWFHAPALDDISMWDRRIVGEGLANSEGDEANYRIFELTARDGQAFKRRRDEAISSHFERSHRASASKFVLRPIAASL